MQINQHIDRCMLDPAAAEEKRRLHELESTSLPCFTFFTENINRGEMPKPVMIKTDSHGEKIITNESQPNSARLTIERIKEI